MKKNAQTFPKRYFGMHMAPGIAEYREAGAEPYRILIGETTIKNMDQSFEGRPVYVRHVEQVDLETLQEDADGYVVRSFFNAVDGKHWVEFIVVSDKGHEAVKRGWKLSNAYLPKSMGPGGVSKGVDYNKEVLDAEYEHLAIVPNPRYEDSVIMSPDDFKTYNAGKEQELRKLMNSKKGDSNMKLNLFKKQKVENSDELMEMSITLPKSKIEKTITQLVNDVDDMEMNKDEEKMADGDHHVMVGEKKMTVNDLVKSHMACMNELADLKKEHEALKAEKAEKKDAADPAEEKEGDKKDLELEGIEKKSNSKDKKEGEEDHFEALKNAHAKQKNAEPVTVMLASDKVALGKKKYGAR